MRRTTRLGLAAVVLVLVLFGAYAAYWRIAAGRIEEGVVAWQQSMRARKIDASWRKLRVTGFPFDFRVALEGAALRDRALSPAPQLHLPVLTGNAHPWNLADWRLAAPAGLSAGLAAAGDRPPLRLAARTAEGTVSRGPDGAGWLWLRLHDAKAAAGAQVPVKTVDAWITLPATPPLAESDPSVGLAVDLRQLHLPAPLATLSGTIDELAFAATVKGAVPDGPLVPAIAAWRDAGGTIELDHLHLKWGGLAVTATGTVALDQGLQPIAAFSGGIEGFATILSALVDGDRLNAQQATLLRIALSALAEPGPGGRPQIATSFTIQNGKMYLGPAQLGEAPRIAWQ
ncbi:MAG: DUF2125 domain-containing protein [Stellaceae bacterium]